MHQGRLSKIREPGVGGKPNVRCASNTSFCSPAGRTILHNAAGMMLRQVVARKTRRAWSAVNVGALCLVLGCSPSAPPKSQPSELLERVMPTFSMTSLNGTAIDTGGFEVPLVVKFFDADCDACARTLPAAQGLYQAKPDVAVIGVSEDSRPSRAREVVAKYKLRFPVVVDADNSIAHSFQLKRTPMTFIADERGRIRWVGGANMTEDMLVAAVESIEE